LYDIRDRKAKDTPFVKEGILKKLLTFLIIASVLPLSSCAASVSYSLSDENAVTSVLSVTLPSGEDTKKYTDSIKKYWESMGFETELSGDGVTLSGIRKDGFDSRLAAAEGLSKGILNLEAAKSMSATAKEQLSTVMGRLDEEGLRLLGAALSVWPRRCGELEGTGTVGGTIRAEVRQGFVPRRGWPEFLETMWLLEHYLEQTRRICDGRS
jgi:hypothetical protein